VTNEEMRTCREVRIVRTGGLSRSLVVNGRSNVPEI
jgi:hypothetical protein